MISYKVTSNSCYIRHEVFVYYLNFLITIHRNIIIEKSININSYSLIIFIDWELKFKNNSSINMINKITTVGTTNPVIFKKLYNFLSNKQQIYESAYIWSSPLF